MNDEKKVTEPNINISSSQSPVTITLTCNTPEAKIYYSLDGSDPNPDSVVTLIYKTPLIAYNNVTIKAVAVKVGLERSNIITKEINVTPIILTIGESYSFNEIQITPMNIFWRAYSDYQYIYTTYQIAIEFKIHNTGNSPIETNPIYSWGSITELPSLNQLSSVYVTNLWPSNCDVFDGYEIQSGNNITDTAIFKPISETSESFIFKCNPPYNGNYYFEIHFNLNDINKKAIN